MSKKVLIVSSSFRKNSNSEMLATEFANGVKDAGNDVEVITLRDKNLNFCKGCLACQKTMQCVIKDDAVEIAEKMKKADVLVFVTPVYYYSISGQLKTMLDRANPLYPSDYQFRDIYLLTCAAEDEESTAIGAKKAIQGWVDCFGKAKFKATVFGGGVGDPGDMEGHKALKEAYNMGKTV